MLRTALEALLDFVSNNYIAQATGLSIVVGILRVAYDDKETTWQRVWLEAAMCGFLTLGAGQVVRLLGVSEAWAFVFGGTLAFVGVTAFRRAMLDVVKARWGNKNDDQV